MNKNPLKHLCFVLIASTLLLAGNASATLTIKITKGNKASLPIAIVPFSWEVPGMLEPTDNLSDIIENDLHNSGTFDPLPQQAFLSMPHTLEEVQYGDWKILGATNILIGQVLPGRSNGIYTVKFRLLDTYSQKQLAGMSFHIKASQFRQVAHKMSNIIFKELTGVRGAFLTRIAYVSVDGNRAQPNYKLIIADSDGYNPVDIFKYHEPVLSPSWSPDGKKIAYVSMENKRSEIFVQEITTGKREKIASFKGINGAPAWSPNGKKMALALSKENSLEIYIYDLKKKRLKRLTKNLAIDTEPTWLPDGKSLIFTSDRSGSPQLYQIKASGGKATRLTFDGRYNALADISPDGKKMAFIHRQKNQYQIAIMDLESKHMDILTTGKLDESPSFSPNGSMIIYATQEDDKGILAAVSPDGEIQKTLSIQKGSVREPDWSPFIK